MTRRAAGSGTVRAAHSPGPVRRWTARPPRPVWSARREYSGNPHSGFSCARRTACCLHRAGLIVPEPRKRPRSSYIRFAAEQPSECWQSDFTYCPLAAGTGSEILTWLDDHARYALSVTAHPRVTGPIVVNTFRAAVAVGVLPAGVWPRGVRRGCRAEDQHAVQELTA
jgi:hypothetical protein